MSGQRKKTVVLSANTSWYLLNFRKATIHALVDAGFEVVCLAPQDDYSDHLSAIPGCRWIPLEMDNQGSNPLRDAALFLRFMKAYRQLRPAVVCHFTIKNNVYGTWAAAILGIPALTNITGLGTSFLGSGLVPKIARLLYRGSQRFTSQQQYSDAGAFKKTK
ncbi:MAG: glycosyltransferase [Halioglobus sp.]